MYKYIRGYIYSYSHVQLYCCLHLHLQSQTFCLVLTVCLLTIILFAVDRSAKQNVLYTVLGSHGAFVSKSSEVDGEFPFLVSTVLLHGRSLCTSYLPVFAINIGNQVDGEFSTDGFTIPYYTGEVVYTNRESTSSLEITAQPVGFLLFHPEINLHFT